MKITRTETLLGVVLVLALAVYLLTFATLVSSAWGQLPPTVTPNLTPIPTFTPAPTRVRPSPPPPPPTSTYVVPQDQRRQQLWKMQEENLYLYAQAIDDDLFSMQLCKEVPDPSTGRFANPPFLQCDRGGIVVDKNAWRWLRYRAGHELGPAWR